MQCAKCGSDNPGGKKFCGDCGAALTGDVHPAADAETVAISAGGDSSDIAWLRRVFELGNAFVERGADKFKQPTRDFWQLILPGDPADHPTGNF